MEDLTKEDFNAPWKIDWVGKADHRNNNTGYHRLSNGVDIWFSDIHPIRTAKQARKVAKLIKASPKMLKALIDIINTLEEQLTEDALENESIIEEMDNVYKVIKEATGINLKS